jgi:hypothetical protein
MQHFVDDDEIAIRRMVGNHARAAHVNQAAARVCERVNPLVPAWRLATPFQEPQPAQQVLLGCHAKISELPIDAYTVRVGKLREQLPTARGLEPGHRTFHTLLHPGPPEAFGVISRIDRGFFRGADEYGKRRRERHDSCCTRHAP